MELKKKSISIHTVVTIVLAVLLALSLALGLTGAWFTDKATGTGNVNFGKVEIGDSVTVNVPTNLVPTQEITFDQVTYNGVPAFYRVSVDVDETDYKNKLTSHSGWPTLAKVKEVLSKAKAYGAIGDYFTSSTNTTLTNEKVSIAPISIPNTVDNTFQEVSCILKVTIDVIQQAGTAESIPVSSATTAWEAIFAKCSDYTDGTPA